jgi:hypothetical protein
VSDLAAARRALAAVCLGESLDAAAVAALGGDAQRWQVYRDLVRNRLWALAVEGLPRSFAAVGAERFGGWFTRFLGDDPPRTHFARDVAPALAGHVLRVEGDALSPWLREALAHDVAEHFVGLTDARLDPARVTDFAMHLPAALAPSHRRLRLEWERVEGEWVERPRALLLHRDAATHAVETLALTPMAADVLDALDDGRTPAAEAVRAVLARHDVSAGAVFIESLAGLLADLMERGVLVGSRRAE